MKAAQERPRPNSPANVQEAGVQLLRQASALSYLDGFRVMTVLLLLAIPAVWITRKPQFKSPHQGAA